MVAISCTTKRMVETLYPLVNKQFANLKMAQSKKKYFPIKNGDFKHGDFPFRYVNTFTQWPFQEPNYWRYRFHICLAYFLGLNFREYPHKIWLYMVQYLHFRILKISHWLESPLFIAIDPYEITIFHGFSAHF